jgi:hypothetical protein
MKYFLPMLVLFAFTCGCAKQYAIDRLSAGYAKANLIKGSTTQNEVLEYFGGPNVVSKNKSGTEVWTYSRSGVDRNAESGYWNVLVVGSKGNQSHSSARSFTLMITFDENNVIEEYTYRESRY